MNAEFESTIYWAVASIRALLLLFVCPFLILDFCSTSVVFRHCKLVSEMFILFHCCASVLMSELHYFGSDGSGKSWNQILSCLWIYFLWLTLLWLFLCLHMTVIWILGFFFSTFVNGVIGILVRIALALQLVRTVKW